MREGAEPGRANNQENTATRSKSKGLQVWLKATRMGVRQQQRQGTLKKAVKDRKQQECDQRREQEHAHERVSVVPNQGFRKKERQVRTHAADHERGQNESEARKPRNRRGGGKGKRHGPRDTQQV